MHVQNNWSFQVCEPSSRRADMQLKIYKSDNEQNCTKSNKQSAIRIQAKWRKWSCYWFKTQHHLCSVESDWTLKLQKAIANDLSTSIRFKSYECIHIFMLDNFAADCLENTHVFDELRPIVVCAHLCMVLTSCGSYVWCICCVFLFFLSQFLLLSSFLLSRNDACIFVVCLVFDSWLISSVQDSFDSWLIGSATLIVQDSFDWWNFRFSDSFDWWNFRFCDSFDLRTLNWKQEHGSSSFSFDLIFCCSNSMDLFQL